jgi:hypothetical protein
MAKHNKKRNVGLIHEQLVRHASEKIVDGRKNQAKTAVKILNKHFGERSALQKEFRLFNALVHTSVPTRELARQIIHESKNACRDHEDSKLRREKSLLIRDINHQVNESNFYKRKVSEYKIFATVQALLNEWRGADRLAPDEIVKYEKVLEDWLVRDTVPEKLENLNRNKDANPLTLKIMLEKFNKKYLSSLNEQQARLLESRLAGDSKSMITHIHSIKKKALQSLEKFYQTCDNKVLHEKQVLIESKIKSLEPNVSDDTISKALTISALTSEIEDEHE